MRLLLMFALSSVLFSVIAEASIIGLKVGAAENYMTLNLTKHGDVAFTICPAASPPVAECDASGQSTLLMDRALFDSKLKQASAYDGLTLATLKEMSNLKEDLAGLTVELNNTTSYVNESQKRIAELDKAVNTLTQNIKDVEKRLLSPNLDPQDRKELEAYVKKATDQKTGYSQNIVDEKTNLATLQTHKSETDKQVALTNGEIQKRQTILQDRKKLLDAKAVELKGNLNGTSELVAYENESIYFMAFFAFDSKNAQDNEVKCSADAAYTGGLGEIRAKFKISGGIFPKMVQVGSQWFELYDGVTHDISMHDTGHVKWSLYDRDIFDFKNPYANIKVICRASANIPGEDKFTDHWTQKGELIPGNTSCFGKPAREYTTYSVVALGHFQQKEAETLCKTLNPIGGFGHVELFQESNARAWGNIVAGALNPAFLKTFQIKGSSYLKDGFYSWGSTNKPLVFSYDKESIDIEDLTGTPAEKIINDPNTKLPVLCVGVGKSSDCDD